jgi:hypothetical protein
VAECRVAHRRVFFFLKMYTHRLVECGCSEHLEYILMIHVVPVDRGGFYPLSTAGGALQTQIISGAV